MPNPTDYEALSDLLNVSDDELADIITRASNPLPEWMRGRAGWPGTGYRLGPPRNSLSRGHRMGEIVVPNFPSPESLGELVQSMRGIAMAMSQGNPSPSIPPAFGHRLMVLANYPTPLHVMTDDESGQPLMDVLDLPCRSQIVRAARALWPILEGAATLVRCPAPAPRPPNGKHNCKDRCGKWFVVEHGRGRPRRYCSITCAKRASRRGETGNS